MKKKNFFSRVFIFCILLLMSTGFHTYLSGEKWPISVTDSTIWVVFQTRPAITKDDLALDDPMSGQTITFDSLSQSVFDDYNNNVPTSFFRLKDSTTDPAYNVTVAANRTINVEFVDHPDADVIGDLRGNAEQVITDGIVSGCEIRLNDDIIDSAKAFVETLTHELGHCVGLDHSQETRHAIMSYDSDKERLQGDDKAGITYLYPADPSYGDETATFGLSCTPKD